MHAPGAVEVIEDTPASARFTVRPWSPRPSFVVVHGLTARPPASSGVRIDGQPVTLEPPHQYLPDRGILILQLAAARPAALSIRRPASDRPPHVSRLSMAARHFSGGGCACVLSFSPFFSSFHARNLKLP